MSDPSVDRPDMPASYGPTRGLEGVLPWSWADDHLRRARSYWVATVTADGAPHAAPVWGVWVDGALWFGTDPASAKGHHLARDPRVVVHLESGDEVVIVHGEVDRVPVTELEPEFAERLDDHYGGKYADPATGEAVTLTAGPEGSAVCRVTPAKVIAWRERDFLRSRTRWRFGT